MHQCLFVAEDQAGMFYWEKINRYPERVSLFHDKNVHVPDYDHHEWGFLELFP